MLIFMKRLEPFLLNDKLLSMPTEEFMKTETSEGMSFETIEEFAERSLVVVFQGNAIMLVGVIAGKPSRALMSLSEEDVFWTQMGVMRSFFNDVVGWYNLYYSDHASNCGPYRNGYIFYDGSTVNIDYDPFRNMGGDCTIAYEGGYASGYSGSCCLPYFINTFLATSDDVVARSFGHAWLNGFRRGRYDRNHGFKSYY